MPFDGTNFTEANPDVFSTDSIYRALSAAQEIIRAPQRWIDSPRGRTAAGVGLNTGIQTGAVQWCALGALDVALNTNCENHAARQYLEAAAKQFGYSFAAAMNWDGHESAMKMFDRAKELRAKALRDEPR